MKTQIRPGVFETNSSSTHALTIMTIEDYEKFVNGEIDFDGDPVNLDDDWGTYDYILERYEYETERVPGDKYIAVSYFGHDY